MGVLPLEFKKGESSESLGLDGSERFTFSRLCAGNHDRIPTLFLCAALNTRPQNLVVFGLRSIGKHGDAPVPGQLIEILTSLL